MRKVNGLCCVSSDPISFFAQCLTFDLVFPLNPVPFLAAAFTLCVWSRRPNYFGNCGLACYAWIKLIFALVLMGAAITGIVFLALILAEKIFNSQKVSTDYFCFQFNALNNCTMTPIHRGWFIALIIIGGLLLLYAFVNFILACTLVGFLCGIGPNGEPVARAEANRLLVVQAGAAPSEYVGTGAGGLYTPKAPNTIEINTPALQATNERALLLPPVPSTISYPIIDDASNPNVNKNSTEYQYRH